MRSEQITVTWREVNGIKAMELPDGTLALQDKEDALLFIDKDNNRYRIDPTDKFEKVSDFKTEEGLCYEPIGKEDLEELSKESQLMDKEVNRCLMSTSINTWDLLRKNVKPFSGVITCDFCYSKKDVEYSDIVSKKVDWFATGQFLQQLLDIKLHFVCSDCSVKLQNKFRQVAKEFVEKEKRSGMFENQGLTVEEKTALTTGFFGVGNKA